MADIAASIQLPARRIVALDALRGVAVIGIALMNVYIFALPQQAYLNPRAWGGDGFAELTIWALSFVFVEDKFRTLFAMLFGMGCAMLLARGRKRRLEAYYARMAILFVIGLAHATLLASNDILRTYALAGLVLPLFLRLKPPALLAWAGGLLMLHIVASSTVLIVGSAFAEANFGADGDAILAALDQGREAFPDHVARRVAAIPADMAVVAGSIPLNLAAMLVGMALWRKGLLAGQWRVNACGRLAFGLALLSIPVLLALAGFTLASGLDGATVGMNALVLSAPFDLLLGTAYAAAAMALFQRRESLGPIRLLAATGRLSLTNYLATSMILSAIYASWGLGLFGALGRPAVLGTALLPIALMLVWSPLWLARFHQGPLEWLWRGVAQARFGPLLR